MSRANNTSRGEHKMKSKSSADAFVTRLDYEMYNTATN